jgi:hypothetical protein
MRAKSLWISLLAMTLTACGQAAAPTEAGAQPTVAGEISAADHAAILTSQNLNADARGQVENECGERVSPQYLNADIGEDAAVLLVMSGGPNTVTCYGDGPGLTLLKREGPTWRAIYFSRGGFMAILPTEHAGMRDIAFAGPGFEHPLFVWNGAEYAPANRSISDTQLADATILP